VSAIACAASTPLSPTAAATAPPLVIGLRACLHLSQSHLGALASLTAPGLHVARRRADRPQRGGCQPPAQHPHPFVQGASPRRLHQEHPPPADKGDCPRPRSYSYITQVRVFSSYLHADDSYSSIFWSRATASCESFTPVYNPFAIRSFLAFNVY